ncbi:glycosyltransferase [Podospora australis]|uniref:Glycosyltransferase n=1 Tax=Podospora australis TaxID=1536484 RepID=A0AAN6WQL3_9PEZI|nr:glycosyltransferase [Podospora australis]
MDHVPPAQKAERPVLVFAAFAASGHNSGLIQFARHLVSKGYTDLYFINGAEFRQAIERTGAIYVQNPWTWHDKAVNAPPPSPTSFLWHLKYVFAESTPDAYRTLKQTLEDVHERHPGREVIIVHESAFCGLAPFYHGAPLPKGYSALPKVINFHASINTANDDDVPPFGPGFVYDPTPQNKNIWKAMQKIGLHVWKDILNFMNAIYTKIGANIPLTDPMTDVMMILGDVTIVATSPSLEYPRPNLDKNKIRFIGGLPLKALDPNYDYPAWWDEITANAALSEDEGRKKVVFVSQGTFDRNLKDLLVPTIRALGSDENLMVVATLGMRGESSPLKEEEIPGNTKIVDYLAYDAILPYTDVFVCNAGYGGFMHGVMNGVAMVLAGMVNDKAEVSARAEYAGVAVNLRSNTPSGKQIKDGVAKVLSDKKFKETVVKIQQENEELDAMGQIERLIEELADGSGKERVDSVVNGVLSSNGVAVAAA